MEMAEPTSKDDQDRPRVHHTAWPCKLLQDALTSILKCLGLEGSADNSSTPGDEKINDQGRVRGFTEEEDSVEDSSVPTRQELQSRDVFSGAAQDPTAADDPPPSSTEAVESESDAIITRALFRKPTRLPVNTGSGPKKN